MLAWLAWGRPAWCGRFAAAVLAAAWSFVGWAYLLERYETINWAAKYFAAGFAMQVLLLGWLGIFRGRLAAPSPRGRDAAFWIALALAAFAIVGYSLIAPLVGRPWTQAEVFGLAPDPTVAATLAIAAAARSAWLLWPIPLAWCALSGLTLWTMEQPEALLLPALGAIAFALALWRKRLPAII
jgi:hypothetical protein